MNALQGIVLWGVVSVAASVTAGVVAAAKNRDHSWWAAWCFVLPPMLIFLFLLGPNKGARPRRPSMDEEDRRADGEYL